VAAEVKRAALILAVALLGAGQAAAQQRPEARSNVFRRVIQNGNIDSVRALLEAGTDPNVADEYGMTPLAVAAMNKEEGILRLLLDAGADPNRVDAGATTALQHAVEWGDLRIVLLLLDRGADPNLPDAIPALLVAAEGPDVEIVKLLLARGADPHQREDATDRTPREGVEKALEDMKDFPDPQDSSSRARVDSFRRGLREVRDLLVAAEARVPPPTVASLIDAARLGKRDAAAGLLARGAKVDSADQNGRTPLRWAAFRGHTDVMQLLLDRGAKVDAQDRWGSSVLMAAARRGRLEAVRVLLRRKANVNLKSQSGETALIHCVGSAQAPAIARLLLEHGADISVRDLNGYTAADLAAIIGQTELVTLLRGARAKR